MKISSHRSQSFFFLLSLAALLVSASGVHANDVRLYGVVKGVNMTQTSTSTPTTSSGSPFQVQIFVDLCAKQGMNSATVQYLSNSITQTVSLPATNDYSLQVAFTSAGLRDAAYPNGTYTMTLNAVSDGTKTCALTVVDPGSALPAPHLGNWLAAQTINAGSDFTVMWDAWSGGTTNDFVQFRIGDGQGNDLFKSPDFSKSNSLNGTSTSFVIPKGTLMAGQTYSDVTLFFARANLNTGSYPGVPGLGGYFVQTAFIIKTVDVQNFLVSKQQQFSQTGTSSPSSQGYQFTASVNSDYGTGSVSSASVQVLGGTSAGLIPLSASNQFNYKDSTNLTSTSLLDARYANGAYLVTINPIHDPAKNNIPLSLTGNNYPGTTPRISNFNSAQTINAGADFTFTWDAFSGGTTSDFIQFQIKDNGVTNGNSTVFNTGQPLQSGALNGTATSVTVPAGTLTPGNMNLSIRLLYAHLSSTDIATYPGVVGFAAYAYGTKCPIRTVDVDQYVVAKGQLFNQTNAAGPPVFSNFVFNASLKTSGTGQVSSATVQLPSAGAILPMDPNNDFGLNGSYPDQGTLDAAWPNGTYTLTINTVHDGTKNISLAVTSDAYPTTTPQISNYAAAQSINSCTNFTLTWNSLGGMANDFVKVEVSELNSNGHAFKSPELGQAGCLNGMSTSVTIPANTLKPGRTYQATLLFAKGIYDTSGIYPGPVGLRTYFKKTQFTMVANGTLFRPKMRLTGPFSINQFQFNVDGEDQRGYVLDYTTNLLSSGTVWSSISTNYGSFPFTDSNVPDKIRFYRVREGR